MGRQPKEILNVRWAHDDPNPVAKEYDHNVKVMFYFSVNIIAKREEFEDVNVGNESVQIEISYFILSDIHIQIYMDIYFIG